MIANSSTPIINENIVAEQNKLRSDVSKNKNTCTSLGNALASIMNAALHKATEREVNMQDMMVAAEDIPEVVAAEDIPEEIAAEDIPDVKKFISLIAEGKIEINKQMMVQLQAIDEQVKATSQVAAELESKVTILDNTLKDLSKAINEIRQYIKTENLLFHNFPQPRAMMLSSLDYSCYMANLINQIFGPHLPFPVLPLHISTAHRLRTKSKKSIVTIVRFTHRHIKEAILARRSLLEGMNMNITEHLIPEKLAILTKKG